MKSTLFAAAAVAAVASLAVVSAEDVTPSGTPPGGITIKPITSGIATIPTVPTTASDDGRPSSSKPTGTASGSDSASQPTSSGSDTASKTSPGVPSSSNSKSQPSSSSGPSSTSGGVAVVAPGHAAMAAAAVVAAELNRVSPTTTLTTLTTTTTNPQTMADNMEVESPAATTQIDESLYSRQLYVLGHEAMQRMSAANVLIVGLKGLGIEIAKNVCLAGVKSVTIYDPATVELADLSSQFFLTEADVGVRTRAEASLPRLAELNRYVPVSILNGELDAAAISSFRVVVLTDAPVSQQLAINDLARANARGNTAFISATTRGLFALTFCDFGNGFVVSDVTGESPLSGIVSSIENSTDAVVTCLDETRHGLEDGDYVSFTEVEGMTELNGAAPRPIKVLGPYTFSIGDTTGLGTYVRGGIFTQVPQPKTIKFSPLREARLAPEFVYSDFAKFDRPAQILVAFEALDRFVEQNGRLPKPRSEDDATKLVALAHELNGGRAELDDKLVKEIAYGAEGELPPMTAVIGGLIAQEVLKACTGKFHPVLQFFTFDALEALPNNGEGLNEATNAPRGTRYDRQLAVFGQDFMNKIANAREFLVGAGAIGCEMLKVWAMMGLGTGPEGSIAVTDMDTIEKSNLNRQFLFRQPDVGKQKSAVAAAAVENMNPQLRGKITSYQDRVGPDTEAIFNDDFFARLTNVTNALDNVEARKYMDGRCVFARKPLLESGTLGTKGNTQVVIPDLTESYSASSDPPEKEFPMCTVKNFPNQIEHCIQWARKEFDTAFVDAPSSVNMYLTQPDYIEQLVHQGASGEQSLKEVLVGLHSFLVAARPMSFNDCVAWARHQFEENFNNSIQQLLFSFPRDSVTSTGALFWSGPKRAPTAIAYDASNEAHVDYILAAANLHAFSYGLRGNNDREAIRVAAAAVPVTPFVPKTGVKIATNDAELNELRQRGDTSATGTDVDEVERLRTELPAPASLAGFRLIPADFEKDDDTNFHIDYITAAANLRASNYAINNADRHKVKFIAGKIVPAIATTTALVVGLVNIELYKVIAGAKQLEQYKNGFVNLALPFFGFSDPVAPKKGQYFETEFTEWDRFDLEDVTLQQLVDHFQKTLKLDVSMVSCGRTMIYSSWSNRKVVAERLPLKIVDLVEQVSKKPVPAHTRKLVLVVCVTDENDEDVDIPEVHVHIRR
ncbi:ubiquitin-activating enzyme E1 [Ramicandelaber brevisporus]|nr:ubiquitin-activating enzyme E1 [Ramicandelaber brevisporus]